MSFSSPSPVPGRRRPELIAQLEQIFLAEGFSRLTVDEVARRLQCSKSTLYSIASTREQIVQAVVRNFFASATEVVEETAMAEADPALRVRAYLHGVGAAMRRSSPEFYRDLVGYPPTAEIYRVNSKAAARRVREFIDEGVRAGAFRPADAAFLAGIVAMAIDGIQSGRLLESTSLTAGDAFGELGDFVVRSLSPSA